MDDEQTNPDRARLTAFLRDRDAACPLCSYNLRGLTGTTCPECGREIQLTIGLTDPFLAAWITLAAALATSGGMGICVAIISVRETGFKGDPLFDAALWWFLLCMPLTGAAVIWRRRFLRIGRGAQWRWSMAAVVCAVVAWTCFVMGL